MTLRANTHTFKHAYIYMSSVNCFELADCTTAAWGGGIVLPLEGVLYATPFFLPRGLVCIHLA